MQRKIYVFNIWNRAYKYGMKEEWKTLTLGTERRSKEAEQWASCPKAKWSKISEISESVSAIDTPVLNRK